MVAALAALEKGGVVHGDLAASSLWLTDSGNVQLTGCGVRRAIQQCDPSASGAVSFEMLDYIAPEMLEPSEETKDRPSPATSTPAACCGGICWPVVCRWQAGTMPSNCKQPRTANSGRSPHCAGRVPIFWLMPLNIDAARCGAAAAIVCRIASSARAAEAGAGRRLLALDYFAAGDKPAEAIYRARFNRTTRRRPTAFGGNDVARCC